MSEKRFVYGVIKGSRQAHIKDCHNCKSATIDVYDDDFKYFVDKLNEQQATIDELRLQKKDNGLSVYVVRDGKNPVAMFFNEQRASFYCQEHMANLTYQQEKWCRVE